MAKQRMCRARRSEAELTPVAVHQWSGGAVLRGGVRRRWSWHGGCRRRGPSPTPQGKRDEGEVRTKEDEKGRGERRTEWPDGSGVSREIGEGGGGVLERG
jgi:hypothetical protein